MAKRQNFVVGSTNPVTVTKTQAELNNGWNKYQVLKAGDLDGVFNAVSDYSNDSSQEIWNAIRILKGSNPTGASTNELGNIINTVVGAKATKATDFITPLTSNNKGATKADLNTLREEIETSSLTFKGYVATSAPSSSTYGLVKGNIWINASAMPTTFPVPASSIRVWNGTSWATTTDTYTVQDFDFFRNINDGEGYYWFGGQWVVMSTDMSTTYFTLNQTSGKWEIKSSVNLPGNPTTTTQATTDNSTRIATTKFVKDVIAVLAPSGTAADTDMSNLSETGKNISNWSSNVSNCITNIPQDIKLELSNGTLTLKAGSKLYKPNGTGVFDTFIVETDLSRSTWGSGSTDLMVAFDTVNATWGGFDIPNCHSGPTAPTGATNMLWYDTTNNKVKQTSNSGSTWNDGWTLPIFIVSRSSGAITSIQQVFNGFGYIGSTVFVLPGVKGLIPDGRNADGTLKNNMSSLSSVITRTFSGTANISLFIQGNSLAWLTPDRLKYLEEPNKIYDTIDDVFRVGYIAGSFNITSDKISHMVVKTVFHALDYNDIVNVIYPVGSLYFGTQTTCPIQLLYPQTGWSNIATKIITDITGIKGSVGTSSAAANGKYFVAQTTSFNQNTVPASGGYSINVTNNQTITGASVTNSSITVNVWRRDY